MEDSKLIAKLREKLAAETDTLPSSQERVVIFALPGFVMCSLCRSTRVLLYLGGIALLAAGLCALWGTSLRESLGDLSTALLFFGYVLLINGIVLLLGPVLRRVRLR